jgi:oligopeptidase A
MQLPQFNHIVPEKIQPKLQEILENNLNLLEMDSLERPIELFEQIENRLQQFWSPIGHLHAVKSTEALRKAYQECLVLLSDYETTLSHHKKLYQAFRNFKAVSPIEKRILELKLRDFRLAGIDLSDEKKVRYGEIEKALSELGVQFSEHLLDATQSWHYKASEEELKGVPAHLISADRILTLDYPTYSAIQKYAENRELREKCYKAYVTRASELADFQYDNSEVMHKILLLRAELAELLGFKNYAALSLATKMAKTPEQVLTFLNELVIYAKPFAEKELKELTEFAGHELKPWDIYFYGEKLSYKRYEIHQELFRPYFSVDTVLSGLFSLVGKIYGLTFQKRENVEVWDEEVNCFEIYQNNNLCGIFYTDLYTRKLKRDGAWMDDYCSRYQDQIPVAFLTCNFMRPQEGKPGLLTHDDVITVFHEFGHGLHHLLTKINRIDVAGMHGVPWDAVEFPSQFMENFCWQKEILKMLSKHYKTGEVLPDELINKLISSRYFHAGFQLIRQLEFALFDFELHLEKPQDKNFVMNKNKEIHEKVAVIKAPDYNRFPHTFSHIFDGGYAAAYYSYLWAEVLSADAFSLFEENGLFDQKTGQKFLDEVLSQGGSKPPEVLFENFRGRAPDKKAFLKSWGLIA